MVYVFALLSAVLAWTVLLLVWKVALMRRSARELEQGMALRLEEDTNTLLSISSQHHLEPFLHQVKPQQFADIFVVVRNQDLSHRHLFTSLPVPEQTGAVSLFTIIPEKKRERLQIYKPFADILKRTCRSFFFYV